MIVAFDDRRRSSDRSRSDAVRKNKVGPAIGQMIVAFGERRRTSSNASSSDDAMTRKSSTSRADAADADSSPRPRRIKGETSRRNQTAPAPSPPLAPRKDRNEPPTSTRKPRSRREASEVKNRRSRNSDPADKVIVEFPQSSRRERLPKAKEVRSLNGMFKKHEMARVSHAPPSSCTTRKFEDTADWRNTSIDWGDDDDDEYDDEMNATDHDDVSSSNSSACRNHFCPDKVTRRPDPIGRQGCCADSSSQSTEFTESFASSLSNSITSILSIRKIDP